jgi:hypothetical protein
MLGKGGELRVWRRANKAKKRGFGILLIKRKSDVKKVHQTTLPDGDYPETKKKKGRQHGKIAADKKRWGMP